MSKLKFGILGALAVATVSLAGPAQAVPTDLLPGNPFLAIYLKEFPPNLNEQKIFLQNNPNSTTVLGNVGSQNGLPIVTFTSTSVLDPANGFANIKGANGDYHDLTISVPDFTFGDLLFDTQIDLLNDALDLRITAFNGNLELGTLLMTGANGLQPRADQSWLVLAQGGSVITSVVLESTSGIFETKHFQVSDLNLCPNPNCGPNPGPGDVPLPGTVFLMGSVLAGGTGFGAWRRRRRAVA